MLKQKQMKTKVINLNKDTSNNTYVDRLIKLQQKTWKKKLKFLNPYKYHISNICTGKVLEVGCGIGRVLDFLPLNSVGVDHNEKAVQECVLKGFNAFYSKDFLKSKVFKQEKFDTLLFSHVLEHMSIDEAREVLNLYLPYLKKGGKIVLITPQQKGQESDASHVTYMSQAKLYELALSVNVDKLKIYSFPFPYYFSTYFIYNENVYIGIKN